MRVDELYTWLAGKPMNAQVVAGVLSEGIAAHITVDEGQSHDELDFGSVLLSIEEEK
jgi:hypothetical protein